MKCVRKAIIVLLFLSIVSLNPVTTDRSSVNSYRLGPTVKWQDGIIQIRGDWFKLDQKIRDSVIDSIYCKNNPHLK